MCDVTQKESKTDESLAVFTPHAGLAITCNRLLNRNCVMPSIPAELFHEIGLCFAASPPSAETRLDANKRVADCHPAVSVWDFGSCLLRLLLARY